MAYATREDIEKVYSVELLDIIADLDASGTPSDEAVTAALAEVSSEIDTYVGVLYPVPVSPAPPILTLLARDMAVYRLSLQAGKRTLEMRQRYEDAIKLLERIAGGKASLPLPPPAPGDSDGDGDVDDDDVVHGAWTIPTVRRS
ncbi:MAG: gp436 family protein [Bacteroidota bacterium]